MATSGRKPTPAELIDPTQQKKSNDEIIRRREIEKTLRPKSNLTCPNYISDAAKKEWRRIMKLYRSMDADILTDLDVMALIMYCEGTAIYKKAHETWVKYNMVVSANPESQRVLDKCFSTMKEQGKIINDLAEQLCLTPVGRARMGIAVAKTPALGNTISDVILESLKGREPTMMPVIPENAHFETEVDDDADE